ncbi:MAG: hypothetical protein M3Y18_08725 [Candidatus Eremiobacteraeota bacterium]|nr:hypothetical protein [Candidatus Eremiobacteraeota bacterium]
MTRGTRLVLTPILLVTIFFSSLAPASAFLDKTRFAVHLGIAYYCFHHWVLNPYKEGKFAGGAPHRTGTIVKAGAALLFAVTQVRSAQKIARNSNDRTLQKIVGAAGAMGAMGGLGGLAGSLGSVAHRLKSGQFSEKDVADLVGETQTVSAQAAADGAPIKDVPVHLPGM